MGQLHDCMAQDLVLRNFSPATRRNYLLYCRKFAAFHRRSPAGLGEDAIHTDTPTQDFFGKSLAIVPAWE
jgi:hypothetical protein